jgi:hypothetical protein
VLCSSSVHRLPCMLGAPYQQHAAKFRFTGHVDVRPHHSQRLPCYMTEVQTYVICSGASGILRCAATRKHQAAKITVTSPGGSCHWQLQESGTPWDAKVHTQGRGMRHCATTPLGISICALPVKVHGAADAQALPAHAAAYKLQTAVICALWRATLRHLWHRQPTGCSVLASAPSAWPGLQLTVLYEMMHKPFYHTTVAHGAAAVVRYIVLYSALVRSHCLEACKPV